MIENKKSILSKFWGLWCQCCWKWWFWLSVIAILTILAVFVPKLFTSNLAEIKEETSLIEETKELTVEEVIEFLSNQPRANTEDSLLFPEEGLEGYLDPFNPIFEREDGEVYPSNPSINEVNPDYQQYIEMNEVSPDDQQNSVNGEYFLENNTPAASQGL